MLQNSCLGYFPVVEVKSKHLTLYVHTMHANQMLLVQ